MEKEDRIDYIYGADTDNIEPRIGIAYAPNWESGFARKVSGGPGGIAFHAGFGIYDGRIFQSVFSQSGANVRFNPPNALFRNLTTFPGNLNIADPSLGFVFTPGPQTARTTLTLPDEDLEMPSTRKWNLSIERVLPWSSTLKISYQGNHNDKRISTRSAICLFHRSMVRSPWRPSIQRARGRLPGSARESNQQDCSRRAVRWHRPAGPHDQRDLPCGGPDCRQRDQLARAAHQRTPAQSALYDESPDHQ